MSRSRHSDDRTMPVDAYMARQNPDRWAEEHASFEREQKLRMRRNERREAAKAEAAALSPPDTTA